MALLIEKLNVVVRRASIERHIWGGWERFQALSHGYRLSTDGNLAGVCFHQTEDAKRFIAVLEGFGFRLLADGRYQDIAVLDQIEALYAPCDWLKLGRLAVEEDGPVVKVCWLDEDDTATVTGADASSIAVPKGWTYAGSLSEMEATAVHRIERERLLFVRLEAGQDVYFDPTAAEEVRHPASTDATVLDRRGRCLLEGLAGHRHDPEQGLFWLEQAADLGSLASRHQIGYVLTHGLFGAPRDLTRAAKHYRIAAQAGFAASQNNLADMYINGEGVAQSIPEAIYWASRSAEQGEAFAYSTLAELRHGGHGFLKDDAELYKWVLLAVRHLPRGESLKAKLALKRELEQTLDPEDLALGRVLAEAWVPLKQTDCPMQEVEFQKESADEGEPDDDEDDELPTRNPGSVRVADGATSLMRH